MHELLKSIIIAIVTLPVGALLAALARYLKNRNTSISGKWVDVAYEMDTGRELYYAVFDIKILNDVMKINGEVFNTQHQFEWLFNSEICQQEDCKLKLLSMDSENKDGTLKRVYWEFSFSENKGLLSSPTSFNGYYMSGDKKRTVRGLKLTKKMRKQLKKKQDSESILKLLIPTIKNQT